MSLFRLFRFTFYGVFIVVVGIGYYVYIQALARPLENRETKLVVPAGAGMAWLANHLDQQGIIDNRYVFRAYTWINYRDQTIKAGEYMLLDIDSVPELVERVIQGKVIQYSLTLVEGKSWKEYLTLLKGKKYLLDELEGMTDVQIMRALGTPGRHPEGQFAPQTYFFTKGATDLDILRMAHQRQLLLVEEIWAERADDLLLKTPYELMIMASIIEKETGVGYERPEISGVFNNRLRIGMRLQTDPTVIYGMGDAYKGNIRRKDLTTDTPYNTYTRYGLPPTPIAMPGEAALRAAANPQATKALYFVGKGDGTHQFSENLKDHNNAVIKYQLGGKPRDFSSYKKAADDD